jgi:SAM-dependent methyltransferase
MKTQEHFHEADPSGLLTLERFAHATRLNRWMFETIQPFCKGHVLEVGSGIGNLGRYFLEKNFRVTLSDLRDEYIHILHDKFDRYQNLSGIKLVDLAVTDFETSHHDLLQQFDTVFALNVVEHIKDDALAIANCKKLLRPGGHLVILVPAYQALYNTFDEELGHYRRYSKRGLNKLLQSQGLEVFHSRFFNSVGIIGWWINGSLLKKRLIPGGLLQTFDRVVPIVKGIDALCFRRIGLSVISVARMPAK